MLLNILKTSDLQISVIYLCYDKKYNLKVKKKIERGKINTIKYILKVYIKLGCFSMALSQNISFCVQVTLCSTKDGTVPLALE